MEFKGTVTHIGKEKSGTSKSGKDWVKQEVVIKDFNQYPNTICFEAFNKQDTVMNLQIGDVVNVVYNANAREHNGKYYNSLSLWSVQIQNDKNEPAEIDRVEDIIGAVSSRMNINNYDNSQIEEGNDLPF